MNSTMSVGHARKLVEQLKIEASFCRIRVGKTSRTPQIQSDPQFVSIVSQNVNELAIHYSQICESKNTFNFKMSAGAKQQSMLL